jgi:hypothetical protein
MTERTLGVLPGGGGHVGVTLRGAQAAVAQQGLDHADIRSPLQQMGGARVPERVG